MNTVIKHYFEITVHPTDEEVEAPVTKQVGVKVKKWRFPWRINMLATPRVRGIKYQPPPVESLKVFPPLDPVTEFRCDHLSRPLIRMLNVNMGIYKHRNPEQVKILAKALENSWNSIYNYYRKKLRERRLKRLRRKQERKDAKKPKGKSLLKIEEERQEHLKIMATPKKIPEPEKIVRKWKPLEELLATNDRLAMPKEYTIIPPRNIEYINPAALTYQITEKILKLAELPERMKRGHSDVLIPGQVKRSALRAICTPNIERLAQPSLSAREAKKHDDDKYDPWVISKNALRYKPTPRMLELAKPLERE